MIFIETTIFTRHITKLGAEEQLRELQNLLLAKSHPHVFTMTE